MASQGVELGQTPPDDAKRDAVHVAIVPATYSSETVFACAGDRVMFNEDGTVRSCLSDLWDGVIDPFHVGFVKSGQRVWVLMRPGSVKNLRHTWEHVSVEDE